MEEITAMTNKLGSLAEGLKDMLKLNLSVDAEAKETARSKKLKILNK